MSFLQRHELHGPPVVGGAGRRIIACSPNRHFLDQTGIEGRASREPRPRRTTLVGDTVT